MLNRTIDQIMSMNLRSDSQIVLITREDNKYILEDYLGIYDYGGYRELYHIMSSSLNKRFTIKFVTKEEDEYDEVEKSFSVLEVFKNPNGIKHDYRLLFSIPLYSVNRQLALQAMRHVL